jgi:succinate dehydrogenase / fumarate reductase flavoprotein subunit
LGEVTVTERPSPVIRPDLLDLFERDELAKYLTDSELPAAAEAGS